MSFLYLVIKRFRKKTGKKEVTQEVQTGKGNVKTTVKRSGFYIVP